MAALSHDELIVRKVTGVLDSLQSGLYLNRLSSHLRADEENIIRYMAGYIPLKLLNRAGKSNLT